MRKHIIILVILFGTFLTSFAQVPLTVGEGNSVSSLPIGENKYTWVESRYDGFDVGRTGTITKLALNCTSTKSTSTAIKIYLGMANSLTIGSNTAWTQPGQLTLVYNGTTTVGSSLGWQTFNLSTPFNYSDSSKALVVVIATKKTPANATGIKYEISEGSNNTIYRGSNSSTAYFNHPGTATGTRNVARPNIRLTMKFNISTTTNNSSRGNAYVGTSTATSSDYYYGANVKLTAYPNSGYVFYKWSDGSKENPRWVRAVRKFRYKAIFVPSFYIEPDYCVTLINHDCEINPLSNDVIPCSSVTPTISTQPLHGSISYHNGIYQYSPQNNFIGKDSCRYTISCNGSTKTGWMHFLVEPYPDNVDSADCTLPPVATQWGIQQDHVSGLFVHHYAMPFVGDLDNDGHNEVVVASVRTTSGYTDSICIFNDQLTLKKRFKIARMWNHGCHPIALADVNNDGYGEIITLDTAGWLYCYKFNGTTLTQLWRSSERASQGQISASLTVADINADGIPEVFAINKIFNARNGKCLATVPHKPGLTNTVFSVQPKWMSKNSMPVLADIDNDGILEIVGGSTVYKANITNSQGSSGNSVAIFSSIQDTNLPEGFTSVADIDQDGYLDVVVSGNKRIYVWKPYSGANSSPFIMCNLYNHTIHGGSRALCGDLDNDGYLEIAYTAKGLISALKYNPTTHNIYQYWQQTTSDSSGATTMSLFDFNQDGNVEIVYRDETHLRIINGQTGNNLSTFSCLSGTATEYPIVVDLDRDGQAEILVSYCDRQTSRGKIISYRSPSTTTWAPARYVWNQHGYSIPLINNDLTVPRYPLNHSTAIMGPDSILRRPFNNFLQQGTMIDKFGRPFIPASDLTFNSIPSYSIENHNIVINYQITNQGDAAFRNPLYVSLYNGSNCLGIDTITQNLNKGATCSHTITIPTNELCDANTNTLELIVNCINHKIAQNANLQGECDTTNNKAFLQLPSFNSTDSILNIEACDSYTWKGTTYTSSTSTVITETNTVGCDSTITLNLTINHSNTGNETITACDSYSWHGTILNPPRLLPLQRQICGVAILS